MLYVKYNIHAEYGNVRWMYNIYIPAQCGVIFHFISHEVYNNFFNIILLKYLYSKMRIYHPEDIRENFVYVGFGEICF